MNVPSEILPTQPPLAVVGLSALFPKAANVDEFWSNIRRGVDAITEVPATHWNPEDYFDSNQKTPDMTYARRGGFLSPVPFDPLEFGISPNNLEAIDTSQLLGLVGAKRALEHAGYGAGRTFDRSRVGCILGVTGTLEMVIPLGARLGHPRWRKALKDAGVTDDVAEDVVNRISQSYVPWQENSFPGLLGNVVAGRIANRLDLHGTNCVVDAACASSLSAIHLAALELWTGRSDMVVTGGIDTFNDIFMFMCFSKTPALSPSGDAKPFSDEADGTILGEGIGMVVLKRLSDAERDGDRIYAVLKGIGTSSDGAGNAVYAPKAEGQIRCLEDAYRVAGVSPDTIELVEAHGTGTKVGDATEVSGLMHVYKSTGRRGAWCAVGSVKSQIGHTKAAAGAAGVIKAILALQHRVLPPTIKVNQPPAALLTEDSPFYVNTEARPWLKPRGYPRRAAVSAFGFGGSNFHCVLEESPQRFDDPEWDGDVQVITLSSETPNGLIDNVRASVSPLASADWKAIRSFAASSRGTYRAEHRHRLLFVLERDKSDLGKLVTSALTMLERYPDKMYWATPDGAYYGCGERQGKLGVLFPGQGAQYVGMLRELVCRFPAMSDALDEANEVFASTSPDIVVNSRLSDFIYPPPSFSADARERREAELRATQIAQPAIGAVSLAVLSVLDQFGIQPEAVAGHSYGELTALCASRRFSPQVLYRLSSLRGRLMAAAQATDGGMLAVLAPLAQIEAVLSEMSLDLVVANHNSPTQVVLSGRIPDIDRAASLFASRNIRGKKLQVAAAFHSPLVAPASSEFRPVLDEIDFLPSAMPVYANSTATEYPAEPAAARDLLANQLAQPVHFVHEIEQMYADGVRTFLEVGPSSVLTGLVNSILDGRDYRAMAIDSSNGKRNGLLDLANAFANLAASGYPVRWERWDPNRDRATETPGGSRLLIPICGANYVKPRNPIPPCVPTSISVTPSDASAVPDNKQHLNVSSPEEQNMLESQTVAAANRRSANCSAIQPPNASINPLESQQIGQFAVAGTSHGGTLEAIRESLQALERMQQETSRLHQKFLDEHAASLQALSQLASQQFLDQPFPAHNQDNSETFLTQDNWGHHDLERQGTVSHIEHPHEAADTYVEHSSGSSTLTEATDMSATSVSSPFFSTTEGFASDSAMETSIADEDESARMGTTESKNHVPTSSLQGQSTPSTDDHPSPLGETVLAVVAEKTGYPVEMLNLDMSLDHDLGIDSIKRVEILSALQERVANLPAFQPEELGALHTLRDVVSMADARTATVSSAPVSVVPPQPVAAVSVTTATSASVQPSLLGETVLTVVSEKTGYPVEMLNLDMSLDHDLGIDSIKRVEILSALQERVADLPAFQPEELGALHTLRDVVAMADARTVATSAPVVAVQPPPKPEPPQPQSIPRVQPLQTLNDLTRGPVIPAATTSSQPPVAPPQPSAQPSHLAETVLAVVAEKTGYPIEMLNLEMSLDHDLGIDSIKRVEILSALQERVANLPAFQPEELGSLHTLRDVVTLADARTSNSPSTRQSKTAPTPVSASQPSPPVIPRQPVVATVSPSPQSNTVAGKLTQSPTSNRAAKFAPNPSISRSVVRLKAVPPASARPAIKLFPGSEIWVTEDGLGLSFLIAEELKQLGFKPRIVNLEEPQTAVVPDQLAGLIIIAPQRDMDERQLWNAVEWVQKVGPAIRRNGKSSRALLATVSRLDGSFGFGGSRRLKDPISGGLAGLAKCADLEWPEVTSRAFDLGYEWSAPHVAAAMLVTELLHDGPGEVGLASNGPHALEVVEETLSGPNESTPIKPGEVIVVSGGARGVTAETVYAIARAWQPCLVILGRSPEPTPEPGWLTPLATETEIKQALIARAPAGTTPKAISSHYQEILAGREVVKQLQRIRSTGASVIYHSVDVRDPMRTRPLLAAIRRDLGVVRGIIHGAGVLADQRIEDKTKEQFDRVYGTKVTGLNTLLDCVDPNELRLLGLFSSYTARFGRVGQSDYAIANEVLNKQARQFALLHPNCRVASFNWGPWDGGMVQGSLKKIFASEGVGLIPMDAGAQAVVLEFNQTASRPVEVLVLGNDKSPNPPSNASSATIPSTSDASRNRIPMLAVTTNLDSPTPLPKVRVDSSLQRTGGGNTASVSLTPLASTAKPVSQPNAISQPNATPHVMDERSQRDLPVGFKLAFERQLDVANYPFLESHVLGGKAVLPVAMIFEWMAHGAIHGNPGLELRGFDDFRVFQGVRLGARDRVLLRILSGKPIRDESYYKVPMRMIGHQNGREVVHAGGTVVLSPGYPSAPAPMIHVPSLRPYSTDVSTAYATRLFHGQKLQGIMSIEGCSSDGIVVTSRLAPVASAWMTEPVRANWLADPQVIDSALQAVILWSQEMRGMPCLPCAVTKYRQFRRALPHSGVRITIRVQPATAQLIRCEIEFVDQQGLLVARMEGCESVVDASLASAFQKNRIDA